MRVSNPAVSKKNGEKNKNDLLCAGLLRSGSSGTRIVLSVWEESNDVNA